MAAVAWLAELFPEPRRRESVLGYTQAFSSLGGLLVAGANLLAVKYAADLPAIAMPEFLTSLVGTIDPAHQHEGWRYTLMSGLIPALPLIIMRPFLPESPVWAAKKAAGHAQAAQHPGVVRPPFPPDDDRDHPDVRLQLWRGLWGDPANAANRARRAGGQSGRRRTSRFPRPKEIGQKFAATVGTIQEIGGLVGRILLAFLAVRIVSRRKLLRVFQWPDLIVAPAVFALCATQNLQFMQVGIFVVGLLTVAQFSFWGNYLPRVYPVHLRGTGEGFAANIGGRMIGTSFAYVTNKLVVAMPGSAPRPENGLCRSDRGCQRAAFGLDPQLLPARAGKYRTGGVN